MNDPCHFEKLRNDRDLVTMSRRMSSEKVYRPWATPHNSGVQIAPRMCAGNCAVLPLQGGNKMEDREIVDLYWARCDRAIAETDEKYGRFCFAIAGRIVPYREDAEECVQDTWLRTWDAIPPERPSRLDAFLARITRNLALDRLRWSSREKRGGGEVALAYEELEGCIGEDQPDLEDTLALRQALRDFLAALPRTTRIIFLRRYWYFQPIKEIASSLGLSESRVKMQLFRTRNALRQQLEQAGLMR